MFRPASTLVGRMEGPWGVATATAIASPLLESSAGLERQVKETYLGRHDYRRYYRSKGMAAALKGGLDLSRRRHLARSGSCRLEYALGDDCEIGKWLLDVLVAVRCRARRAEE